MSNVTSDAEADSTHTPAKSSSPSILHELRALMPNRRISHIESLRITENQASLLRSQLEIRDDQFPIERLDLLPCIEISKVDDVPASGASFWGNGSWHIHIHAQETPTRHRFTVLHELKHIVDHPNQHLIYDERAFVVYGEREIVADHFASCVLLPADRLSAALRRSQDHAELAAHFGVSRRRLLLRLSEMDLTSTVLEIPRRTTSRVDYLHGGMAANGGRER